LLTLIALVAVSLAACGTTPSRAAEGGGSGALRVVDATIDVPVNPSTAAVRFVIDNDTATADTLTGVSSDVGSAAVHRSAVDAEGRSTMLPVPSMAIPARSHVTFAPGGLHVMITGLKNELRVNDTVKLTLTFTRAGTRTVQAQVVAPGSTTGADDASQMEHDHAT
ncbi:MAG: copper chaperone PCu(A)C, partial [Aquihabitans sp.]